MLAREASLFLAVSRRPLRDSEEILEGFSDSCDRLSVVVRRSKGGGVGACEPPSLVQGLVSQGRSLSHLSQIVLVDAFAAMRGDLERLATAGFLGRLYLAALAPGDGFGEAFRVLSALFDALNKGVSPVSAGLWGQDRLLGLLGIAPDFESCLSCGSSRVAGFSAKEGGVLCNACYSGHGFALSSEAFALCRAIRGAELGVLHSPSREELSLVGRVYREQFVQHGGVSRELFRRVMSRGDKS